MVLVASKTDGDCDSDADPHIYGEMGDRHQFDESKLPPWPAPNSANWCLSPIFHCQELGFDI